MRWCHNAAFPRCLQYWLEIVNGNAERRVVSPSTSRLVELFSTSREMNSQSETPDGSPDGMMDHHESHHGTPSRPPSTLRLALGYQDMNPGDFADAEQMETESVPQSSEPSSQSVSVLQLEWIYFVEQHSWFLHWDTLETQKSQVELVVRHVRSRKSWDSTGERATGCHMLEWHFAVELHLTFKKHCLLHLQASETEQHHSKSFYDG